MRTFLFTTLFVTLSVVLFVGVANGDSNITIHGYLTQAYAFSDGNQILGIPKEGTTDYRNMALQFGYTFDQNGLIVIQFSHKRLGLSPAMAFEDDVKLDWAFVKYQLTEALSIKVGKVQIPFGIYNELRDVGTMLPFYRAPYGIYQEGSWTSETVDGLVLSGRFLPDNPWSFDVSLFYGGWDLIVTIEESPTLIRVKDGAGACVWLNTPIDGLRLGLEGHREKLSGVDDNTNQTSWTASLDGSFERFTTRAEYISKDFDAGFWRSYYAHLGYNISDKMSLNVQADISNLNLEVEGPFFTATADVEFKNYGVGLNYAFRYNLVLKAEHHWTDGYNTEGEDSPNIFTDDPVKTEYSIISLSTSF